MKRILFSFFLSLITILSFATDGFTVADVFTDHMVLQRNAIIKIWGEAPNGSLVEVRFAGQLRKVKASGKMASDIEDRRSRRAL